MLNVDGSMCTTDYGLPPLSTVIARLQQARLSYDAQKPCLAGSPTSNDTMVVLVNGNEAVFREDYLQDTAEGGERAAQRLREAALRLWSSTQTHAAASPIHVVIRVYADLKTLSHRLSMTGTIPPIERSMASFAASFTSEPGCEFIDCGEHPGSTDSKISEAAHMFRTRFACQHVLFVGSLNAKESRTALAYGWIRDGDAATQVEVHGRCDAFDDIFTSPNMEAMLVDESSVASCHYYAKGFCRDGEQCRFLHDDGIFHQQGLSGSLVLNEYNERINEPLMPASENAWLAFARETRGRKPLCNSWHLTGKCTGLKPCYYDHGTLSEESKGVLKHRLRMVKCRWAGLCRRRDCYNDHNRSVLNSKSLTSTHVVETDGGDRCTERKAANSEEVRPSKEEDLIDLRD